MLDYLPPTRCPSCMEYHAEYRRIARLLELLAEDRFPNQAAFESWLHKQMAQIDRDGLPL